MVIYGDKAILGSIGESTMIRTNTTFTNKYPMQEFTLLALEEGQRIFESLIEADFVEGAINANIVTEAVGIALLEEQKENIFQRFWNWLRKMFDRLCKAVKGLWEKIVNFFTKNKNKTPDAADIVKAFKEGNLANVHFNNFIEWNVSAFDQITADKFSECIKTIISDLSAGFESFSRGERKANSMKDIYFDKLPLIKGKHANSNNLAQIMDEVFIKSKGTKEGLSDQEKKAFLDFHNNQTKYQEVFRIIEQNFNSSYTGLKKRMEEFINERSVHDDDKLGTKIKKNVSELATKKIQYCSQMVNAFYSAVTQYLNHYSSILMKANNSITSTIEAGGKAVLKSKSGENENTNEKKEKKVNVKGSKNKAVNASFEFEDINNISFEEAVAYLEESEEEYEELMACEFVA